MIFGPGKWTLTPLQRPGAAVRLICFHHAGGGAFGFRPWAAALRPEIELVAVQLPGRENRRGEPLQTSLGATIDALTAALAEVARRPYAIFGHSFGALLAYAFAARIARTGELAPPARLFLSAARPPRASGAAPRPQLDDDALVARLERLGGLPPQVLNDPALLKLFLPAIRADFALMSEVEAAPPLAVPFTLIRGLGDASATAERMAAWRTLTTRPVYEHAFPGGHFYTQTSPAPLIDILNDTLLADLHRAGASAGD